VRTGHEAHRPRAGNQDTFVVQVMPGPTTPA
jgi:hypothetical protein